MFVAVASLVLTILRVTPARALYPDRTLTQAFHRVWQLPQGLPQATIYAVMQSHNGYIWLGTPTGLIRFDGVRFTTIHDCAGVPAEQLWIRDLSEDRGHNLWLATSGMGLVCYGDVSKQYRKTDGLPSDTVNCVVAARDGTVWAGTPEGSVRLSGEAAHLRADAIPLPALRDVRAIAEAPSGTIWIGGVGNELCAFDGQKWVTHTLATLAPDTTVRALVCTQNGTVWAGTSVGLIRWYNGEETRFTTENRLANHSILSLAAGQDGSLWVGTREGFCRLRENDVENFTPADGLSHSDVYALCEDREGSLWAGTKHGLNQFNDRRTLPFTMREGLPSNDLGPIGQDAAGQVYVGTLGAGLARLEGRRFAPYHVDHELDTDRIRSLVGGEDGQLFVGTERGLKVVRDNQVEKRYSVAEGLPSDVITCICPGRNQTLWVGTAAGMAMLQGDRFVQPGGDAVGIRAPVRCLLERRDGRVLVAADVGLYEYADGELRRVTNAALANHEIDVMCEDDDGHLWLGAPAHGLLYVDNNKVVRITAQEGLLDDEITGLAIDNARRLWMASASGMAYITLADLVGFSAGKSDKLTSTSFRLSDSTRAYEVQLGVQPGTFKSKNGQIWQATTRGLVMVDPARMNRVLPTTPVLVEEVVINGQPRKPSEVNRLPPGSANLSFEYTALTLVVPMRILFRYKLEGFDEEWVEAGERREAFYTNLSPGQYRFRVAATTIDGAYAEARMPVTFTIMPRFYQTRWFLPLCGLIIGLVGLGAYRLRVRNIKDQLRAVVAERSRIARELHDTLMQGFSGVTMQMQALSARLSPSDERLTLDEIIRDAANCLRDARRSVAGLRQHSSHESGLAVTISQAARQLTETGDVRLNLTLKNIPRTVPVDIEYNLLRIAQESVANAVKHAAARTIHVTLNGGGGHIFLSIEDDGIGFAPFEGPVARFGHYGIIGMKERATQIGATFRIDTEQGRGTTVSVRLPLPETASTSIDSAPPPPLPVEESSRS